MRTARKARKLDLTALMATLPAMPALQWNPTTREHDMVDKKPTAFIADGVLQVSGEDGWGFVDYYGEFRGGYPYINQKLEAWAKKHGGMWQWMHPGAIGFYRAMAHKWEPCWPPGCKNEVTAFMSNPHRRCLHCGTVQERTTESAWMRVTGYLWRPLAGRCKPTGAK